MSSAEDAGQNERNQKAKGKENDSFLIFALCHLPLISLGHFHFSMIGLCDLCAL